MSSPQLSSDNLITTKTNDPPKIGLELETDSNLAPEIQIDDEDYQSPSTQQTEDETDETGTKNDPPYSLQIDDGDTTDTKSTQRISNTYAAKKTVAQGMMDIALITANANQLRYIIEFSSNSSTYYLNLSLIIISLFLQVAVGIALIFKGRMDLRGQSRHIYARMINNYVVVGVFLVTIINVFIASFTITGGNGSNNNGNNT